MTVKIVVPDDFPIVMGGSGAESELRVLGDLTVFSKRGADEEAELVRRIGDAEVVLNIRAHARYSASALAQCPNLKLISIWGTGTDHVDLTACKARGITVTNTPGVNAYAVAEHTIALMLAVARRIPAADADVRAGTWPRALLTQLEGKTLGLVGLGAIARRVAVLGNAFGMRVLAWTFGVDNGRAAAVGAHHVNLDTLLRESDVVSLHLRLSKDTVGLLGHEQFALMKPTAYLVNTARGALADKDALLDALREGRIAGAALDVFHEEPIPAGDPILTAPNVVLSPHNAGMTPEVIDSGLRRAVENVALFLKGTPRDQVGAVADLK
jgi:D-3-phosphoglycerate dehydrogenase